MSSEVPEDLKGLKSAIESITTKVTEGKQQSNEYNISIKTNLINIVDLIKKLKNNNFLTELPKVQKELRDTKQQLTESEENLKRATDMLSEKDKSITEIQTELEEKKRELEEKQTELEEKKNNESSSEEEKSRLENEISSLKTQINEENSNKNKVIEEKEKIIQSINDLTGELNTKINSIETIVGELGQIQDENGNFVVEDNFKKIISDLEEIIGKMPDKTDQSLSEEQITKIYNNYNNMDERKKNQIRSYLSEIPAKNYMFVFTENKDKKAMASILYKHKDRIPLKDEIFDNKIGGRRAKTRRRKKNNNYRKTKKYFRGGYVYKSPLSKKHKKIQKNKNSYRKNVTSRSSQKTDT